MILANDFSRQWADIGKDAIDAFTATGASGWYILGEEVRQFETALAGYWKIPHAVGVASGLDAIEISLRTLGCKAGDKVLTTPVSAFATTLAIVRLGAIPVFADVDERGLIDLAAAHAALLADREIQFFVPVHLFGHSLDLDWLTQLRDEFDLAIVEDCAQSIGASWKERPTGSAGQLAATSFYPTKNLGAFGDGGAILTGTHELAQSASVLRDYGQSAKYRHETIGYNSRLDELHACFLRRVSLPRLAQWTARRREVASRYLAEIDHPKVNFPNLLPKSESCWHLFPLLVSPHSKAKLLSHLKACGIAVGEHYPTVIPEQPAMQQIPFEIAAEGIERSRNFCSSEVSLPIHPYLTDEEVTAVVQSVNSWQH